MSTKTYELLLSERELEDVYTSIDDTLKKLEKVVGTAKAVHCKDVQDEFKGVFTRYYKLKGYISIVKNHSTPENAS